jgi:cyanophycinase-like exopeptidase
MNNPGKIVLIGAGETSPRMQNTYSWLLKQVAMPIRIAIVETPAGFEPNSDYVAGQVVQYLEKRLQNFHPQIKIVPARKRGSDFSPDNPALLTPLYDADVIFIGPGSPTYAVRQLQDSLVWHTMRARQRLGATLIFASAAVLAVGAWTLPVYEIYKVGEDLHWKPGLNLFTDFGLSLVLIPHWNNNDGGAVLDTSRCYMGQERFAQLLDLLPGRDRQHTLVGIDENTALVIDPQRERCQVAGAGKVTLVRNRQETTYTSGAEFAVHELGAFSQAESNRNIPAAVWQRIRQESTAAQNPPSSLDPAALALLEARNQARLGRDWAESDRLRAELLALGWQVLDTPQGSRLKPVANG